MSFNINELLSKINKIQKDSKENDKYKELVHKLSEVDDGPNEIIHEVLDEKEKDYYLKRKQYKLFISGFSKPYCEMAEWYCGEELSYKDYYRIFKKTKTYLDSKEDIIELYKLFLFYGILEQIFN